ASKAASPDDSSSPMTWASDRSSLSQTQKPRTSPGPASPPFNMTEVEKKAMSHAAELVGSPTSTSVAGSPSVTNAQSSTASTVSMSSGPASGAVGPVESSHAANANDTRSPAAFRVLNSMIPRAG